MLQSLCMSVHLSLVSIQLLKNRRPTGDPLATHWRPTGDPLATHWRPTGDIATKSCFHILFTHRWPLGNELSSVESLEIKLKCESFLLVLKPINLLKQPATNRRLIVVMLPFKFLKVTGTEIEKMWKKFQIFFYICGGSPVCRLRLKWSVSIREFNIASDSLVSNRWVAGTRKLCGNQASRDDAQATLLLGDRNFSTLSIFYVFNASYLGKTTFLPR